MNWHEHYHLWSEVRRKPGEAAHLRMQAARKRVAENTSDDWRWLRESLDDPDRKWFVAEVFKFQPVPKRLWGPMLRAGVMERDPSFNRVFIDPCVRSFGGQRVLEELLLLLESGTDVEKAGAASAFYWVRGNPEKEDLTEMRERIYRQMLREFVANEDLQVRRRIIPMLPLERRKYPKELRPLVARAVEIARAHPDEYIRHRVEIQLGACGPFIAIPHS